MGGFNIPLKIPLINLKNLNKKYSLLVLREWWVNSKIIADRSVDKALEGWHYLRGKRLHN